MRQLCTLQLMPTTDHSQDDPLGLLITAGIAASSRHIKSLLCDFGHSKRDVGVPQRDNLHPSERFHALCRQSCVSIAVEKPSSQIDLLAELADISGYEGVGESFVGLRQGLDGAGCGSRG